MAKNNSMHEFSIADNIVKSVIAELENLDSAPDGALRKVHIGVGEMRQVVPDTLKFAYDHLAEGTAAEHSELIIHDKPIRALCSNCNWQGGLDEMIFMCPDCGSRDLEIISGKELQLESMEFE